MENKPFMKKPGLKKLVLNKETVASLTGDQLDDIKAGKGSRFETLSCVFPTDNLFCRQETLVFRCALTRHPQCWTFGLCSYGYCPYTEYHC
ncbi:MAG: class I lanthipeptide [Candidatus Omnitrophota bacterium]